MSPKLYFARARRGFFLKKLGRSETNRANAIYNLRTSSRGRIGPTPSVEEVMDALRKLRNNKTPVVNVIGGSY